MSSSISSLTIVVFAVACGLAVASLYYVQPLLETLGRAFGVGEAAAGLFVTVTQLGYAAGLILIAPLGDLLENRRLIATVLSGTVLALVVAGFATSFGMFLAASLAIGVTAVGAQVLVPFAAHLAAPERRGQVVGQVMSGLLMGVLLARAASGIISGAAGWRAVYFISAGLLALTIVVLLRTLPVRRPAFAQGYRALLGSLARIFATQPILRRRIAYQSAMFGSFSAFWTRHHVSAGWAAVPSLADADRSFRARRGRRCVVCADCRTARRRRSRTSGNGRGVRHRGVRVHTNAAAARSALGARRRRDFSGPGRPDGARPRGSAPSTRSIRPSAAGSTRSTSPPSFAAAPSDRPFRRSSIRARAGSASRSSAQRCHSADSSSGSVSAARHCRRRASNSYETAGFAFRATLCGRCSSMSFGAVFATCCGICDLL